MSDPLREQMICNVSELRDGEANDGPLESTDLFVNGRGISLLCNVPAGQGFTYSLIVDGREQSGGWVGVAEAGTRPSPGWICSCGSRLMRQDGGPHCDADMCECGHFQCRHSGIWKGAQQACDDCQCLTFKLNNVQKDRSGK